MNAVLYLAAFAVWGFVFVSMLRMSAGSRKRARSYLRKTEFETLRMRYETHGIVHKIRGYPSDLGSVTIVEEETSRALELNIVLTSKKCPTNTVSLFGLLVFAGETGHDGAQRLTTWDYLDLPRTGRMADYAKSRKARRRVRKFWG